MEENLFNINKSNEVSEESSLEDFEKEDYLEVIEDLEEETELPQETIKVPNSKMNIRKILEQNHLSNMLVLLS